MKRSMNALFVLALLLSRPAISMGDETARAADRERAVLIGAVAYAPSTVTVFKGLTRYLSENGLPADFVLYSSYDALVAALDRKEVDIAWNTPLAHGRFHVKNDCSRTLVMRDIDFNVRSTLVVRADSGIESLEDLAGKKLVLGSSQAAEATVLPLYFLKQKGVDLSNVEIVSLDKEVDSKGNPCASPQHVLKALGESRGDAGIITLSLWNRLQNEDSAQSTFHRIWTSPSFSHCVFTASAEFDESLAAQFTQLMTAMDPNDPMCGEVMRLEGTRKWLPGSPDGFASLIEALTTAQ